LKPSKGKVSFANLKAIGLSSLYSGEQKRGGGAGPGKAELKKAKQEEAGSEEEKGAVQLVGEACNFHKPGELAG